MDSCIPKEEEEEDEEEEEEEEEEDSIKTTSDWNIRSIVIYTTCC
jgi:hypothetical protein